MLNGRKDLANNPMADLRPSDWVACSPDSGLYLGEVSAEELAQALEDYARGIRMGSEDCKKYPPDLSFGSDDKPCVFRRADVPKFDAIAAQQGFGR